MESVIVQSPKSSPLSTSICSTFSGFPLQNSSPRLSTSNSAKTVSPDVPSPVSKSSDKVAEIVKSYVEVKNQDKQTSINKAELYLTKILDKLNEGKRISMNPEKTSPPPESTAPTDKENSAEQDIMNDEPLDKSTSRASIAKSDGNLDRESRGRSTKGKRMSVKSINSVADSNRLINDVVFVSTEKVSFGVNLPGKVLEESLEIINKSDEEIVVQIFTDCLSPELQNTEDYIYSIRRSHLYDYNDHQYVLISPQSMASFKIALKVPNMKLKNNTILGESRISVKGFKGVHRIALSAKVTIPDILCPKSLYSNEYKSSVIKLAIKLGKKPETKFPLKNLSELAVVLDLSFYQVKGVEEDPQFQLTLLPNTIVVPPQGTTIVNLAVKNWKNISKTVIEQERKSFKKVLIGTARNSAVIYSFLLMIELC